MTVLLLLSSCSLFGAPTGDSSDAELSHNEESTPALSAGNETTTADEETTTFGEEETTSAPNHGGDLICGPGPGYADCLNYHDFYIYVTTGSRDPEQYTDESTKAYVALYPVIDRSKLVLPDDIFPDLDFIPSDPYDMGAFEGVLFYNGNKSYYDFSGFEILINYDADMNQTTGWAEHQKNEFESQGYQIQDIPLTDGDSFDFDSPLGTVYFSEINGIPFYRRAGHLVYSYGVEFGTCIDGFRFRLCVYTQYGYSYLFEHPQYNSIAAFFDDSQVETALQYLKSGIEKTSSTGTN